MTLVDVHGIENRSVVAEPLPPVLAAVLRMTDEHLALLNADGVIEGVSASLAGLLGRSPENLVGVKVLDLMHPDEVDDAWAALSYRIANPGDLLPRTWRIRDRDGFWVGVEVRAEAAEIGGRPLAVVQATPTTDDRLISWRSRAVSAEVVVRNAFTLLGAKPATLMAAVDEVVAHLGQFVAGHGVAVFVETPSGLQLLSSWRLDADVYERIGRLGRDVRVLDMFRSQLLESGHVVVEDHHHVAGLEDLAATGARSSLQVAFPYRGGLGLVVAWRSDARPWPAEAIEVARSCAAMIGQALGRVDTDERFQGAFHDGPLGFAMLSWRGEILDCNAQILDQFGACSSEGTALLDRIHPDDIDEAGEAVRALRDRREVRTVLTFRVRRDHDVRTLRAHVSRLGDDTPRSCMFSLVEDITELTHRQRDLEASERSFRQIVEAFPALVFRIDRDGRILMVGREIASRGVSPEDLVGLRIVDIYPDVVETSFWERLMAGFTHGERIEEEISGAVPDGSFVFEVRAVPELGPTGDVESLLILALDVTESRTMAARLAYTAVHDPLTGAVNRDSLLDRLARLAEAGGDAPLSLLFLDLDRFKVVNDSLGHAAGDELLRLVVERIRGQVRAEDVVARLGGDEFAVLLAGADAEAAVGSAERVRRAFETPITVSGFEVRQTVSVGVAVHDSLAGESVEDVLRRADRAMYEAKQRGRNRRELFDDRMSMRVAARTTLEQELRQAILHRELAVHYQPEVELTTRQVVGVEALLRWQHPTRGLLPASEFIEVAEEAGLIHDLGRFVLARATADLAVLLPRVARPLTLRMNVSAREFVRGDLLDEVAKALRSSGIPAESLCLEVTEHTIMGDPDLAAVQIEQIQRLGVQLAIDDFGIGYSSLAQLKRFSMDAIKIDRSFVADLPGARDSRAIVGSILGLARALQLDVVAEGVETEEQARCLRLLGCERAQGYLFGRAVPFDEFLDALDPANDLGG